jgi:hypothetical protein
MVPLKKMRYVSLLTFSGGAHGRKERGDYCFWTAVCKKPVDGKRKLTARALAYLPPGERFERIERDMQVAPSAEDRVVYRMLWHRLLREGANIKYIRPSTAKEIRGWLKTHPEDAMYAASSGMVGSLPIRFESELDEPEPVLCYRRS